MTPVMERKVTVGVLVDMTDQALHLGRVNVEGDILQQDEVSIG